MSFAAADSQDRAQQLLAAMRRLTSLARTEAEALEARRLDASSADFAEKERLAHAYRLEVAQVKANPSLLAGLSVSLREELKRASLELETTLEAHAIALAAAREVTEGLVKAIAGEIASVRSAPAGYGRTGRVDAQESRQASGLAVNAKA